MKKCAGDVCAAATRLAEWMSLAVRKLCKRRVAIDPTHRRVMKFVTVQCGVCGSDRSVAQQARLAVAQVQLAFCEARRMAEESSHGMTTAIGVLKPFAEHHVATTLPVDRTRARKLGQSGPETLRSRQRARVQLWVTSGEPAAVATCGWRLVCERRKRDDLRAGSAPSIKDMGIDEGKRSIRGKRDALAGRRQWHGLSGPRKRQRSRAGAHAIDIEMAFRRCGQAIQIDRKLAMFDRLHQAEMTLG